MERIYMISPNPDAAQQSFALPVRDATGPGDR